MTLGTGNEWSDVRTSSYGSKMEQDENGENVDLSGIETGQSKCQSYSRVCLQTIVS